MLHRKILSFSIVSLLAVVMIILFLAINHRLKKKESIVDGIKVLPKMQLRRIDGKLISLDSLQNSNKLLVLNFFDPECSHCKNMIQEMLNNKKQLDKVSWVMITSANTEKTRQFSNSIISLDLTSVEVVSDTTGSLIKVFGFNQLPAFFVYKEKRLKLKHIGECSISYLLE